METCHCRSNNVTIISSSLTPHTSFLFVFLYTITIVISIVERILSFGIPLLSKLQIMLKSNLWIAFTILVENI